MNKELKQPENEGIIEVGTGETNLRLHLFVIVPKGKSNIRVFVDMRAANKSVTRTPYPAPTADDLLVKLKGLKYFTKLGMTSAFHQVEHDQKSRFVTAFQSDTGIKCFKLPIFGVNSAAEELQHAFQTILANIPGTTNIAEDMFIFSENTKQHEETLKRVLERCESKDTTLNLEKSVFCKNNVKCYDFMFSEKRYGTRP